MRFEARDKAWMKIVVGILSLGVAAMFLAGLYGYGGLNITGLVRVGLFWLFIVGLGLFGLAAIADAFVPGPSVIAGEEGLYFRRFSPATIPWAEFTGLTNLIYNGAPMLAFSLRDRKAFPKPNPLGRVLHFGQKRFGHFQITGALDQPLDALAAVVLHYRPDLAGKRAF